MGGLATASGTGALAAAFAASAPVDLWRLPSPKVHLSYAYTEQSASTRLLIAEVESRLGEAGRAQFVADSDGLGGFINTPAGLAQVDAVTPDGQSVMGPLSLIVRPGWSTATFMRPPGAPLMAP